MIPQKIEELVWSGDAEIRTWTVGTGSASLEVPRGKTIIIYNMLYFPFMDSSAPALNVLDARWMDRANNQLTISTKKARINYLFRAFYTVAGNGANMGMGIGADSTSQNIYFVAQHDINVAIAHIPAPGRWTTVIGDAPKSDIEHSPLTFGEESQPAVVPVTLNINFLAGAVSAEIRPFWRSPPTTLAPIASSYSDFQTPFIGPTRLLPPSPDLLTNAGTIQFPLVTFTYALINKNTIAKIS